MRQLILIKHARPEVREDVASHEWRLSESGRAACGPLAETLRARRPSILITSDEPKAIETGERVGEILGIDVATAPDLHEHDRTNVPLMQPPEFISMMALFFKRPEELVLGRETARDALARIERAVESVLRAHPEGNIAIVTHGTVLALFAAAHQAGDGFSLWRQLGLPSLITFSVPELRALETIARIPIN